jgi:tryptophanyl-tRNA synthetase
VLTLVGIDGRKMSKSYNNTIELSDPPDVIREKVRQMITDRTRIKRTDPGHPEFCDVCKMHRLFVPATDADRYDDDCRNAKIGCVDRKKALADALIDYLAPITNRLTYYREHQDEVREIILEGSRSAREEAGRIMQDVRQAIKIDW